MPENSLFKISKLKKLSIDIKSNAQNKRLKKSLKINVFSLYFDF